MQGALGSLPLESLLVSMDVTSSTQIFHMKMVSKRPGNNCQRSSDTNSDKTTHTCSKMQRF